MKYVHFIVFHICFIYFSYFWARKFISYFLAHVFHMYFIFCGKRLSWAYGYPVSLTTHRIPELPGLAH